MAEEILYAFDDFRLDPLRRKLIQGTEARPLTPTAFDLLIEFVQNPGRTLTKTDLIRRVWSDTSVTDNNFNVTLNAVRRALGESGRMPKYLVRAPAGYCFIAEVREIRVETGGSDAGAPGKIEDLSP